MEYIVTTKAERDKGEQIVKLISDMSINAAISAIAHARGKISIRLDELSDITKVGTVTNQQGQDSL